ncbi:MAG: rhomboid family intramembrane serine protease [Kiritimatiellae bacterium]|nr:rhomboid family intramembrane serine protease [Kiritimatiellia bacterium]
MSNLAIMGFCVLMYVMLLAHGLPGSVLKAAILTKENPLGLIGYQFVHAGFWHLAANMLYLWVFGNAVCEKIGNLAYAGTFLLTGVVAGGIHLIMDGGAAVGASGAINGIVGIYLVLYPTNRVNCFYLWFLRAGTFDIAGYWLILFWFIVDAWQAIGGAANGIAYWAHVGGFLAGLGIGVVCLVSGVAQMARYDNPTLLEYMTGRKSRRSRAASAPRADAMSELARSMVARVSAATLPPPGSLTKDVKITCPHCARNLSVPAGMLKQPLNCPVCGGAISVETGNR